MHNETFDLPNLPVGTQISVTETGKPLYTPSYTFNSQNGGTGTKGSNLTATHDVDQTNGAIFVFTNTNSLLFSE